MHKVILARTAQRDLDSIRGKDLERIRSAILSLESNPRWQGVKKLEDIMHRLRVGDWRVLFAIDDSNKVTTVLRVLRRNERTYKDF